MNEKICRLCLQTISENYQEIEETVKNILSLNHGISKDSVMCIECSNNIQAFFNLKSACVDIRRRETSLTNLNNDVNRDPVNIENANNPDSITEHKDKMRCNFCTNLTATESLLPLHESSKIILLVDVLEKYIPEMNFSNAEELLTCKTCLDGIQSVSSFLMKCLDVEEKINEYTEIEGTGDKGQIKLQNVQQFIFKPRLKFGGETCVIELGQIYNGIQEEFDMKTEAVVKFETEVDNSEPFIRTEDVDIKSEQVDYDSFQGPLGDHKNSLNVRVYKCETCPYETIRKDHLNDHISTQHKDHGLAHKSRSELVMFKCGQCTFETKSERDLNSHIHYSHIYATPSEKIPFKCAECSHETRNIQNLKRHILTHRKHPGRNKYKCGLCTFEGKRIFDLRAHIFSIHNNSSEKILPKCELLKCESCCYETRYRQNLKRHILIAHDDASENPLLKCGACSYKTRDKQYLTRHLLTHKSASEVKMFKCALCAFETKRKDSLKNHTLTHRDRSKIMPINCEMCGFETLFPQYLRRHIARRHSGISPY